MIVQEVDAPFRVLVNVQPIEVPRGTMSELCHSRRRVAFPASTTREGRYVFVLKCRIIP